MQTFFVNSRSSLLLSVDSHPTKTPPSVCPNAEHFTVNSAGTRTSPRSPAPIFSPSFLNFFIYIYASAHHKPVQRASGSSWACGHNTERVPHQSSLHPARREEGRAKREEEEERKSGTNSVSHTHRKSVFAHGKIAAHICGVALRIHQSPCPDRFSRADSLTLAPTLIFLLLRRLWQRRFFFFFLML